MKTDTKTATVRARIEPGLKLNAETILNHLGLKPTEAITMFYKQIELNHGLPFQVKMPNAETIQAFKELEADRGKNQLKTYGSVEDMFKDLEN
jgi:DNA-damage-inducible protein J